MKRQRKKHIHSIHNNLRFDWWTHESTIASEWMSDRDGGNRVNLPSLHACSRNAQSSQMLLRCAHHPWCHHIHKFVLLFFLQLGCVGRYKRKIEWTPNEFEHSQQISDVNRMNVEISISTIAVRNLCIDMRGRVHEICVCADARPHVHLCIMVYVCRTQAGSKLAKLKSCSVRMRWFY